MQKEVIWHGQGGASKEYCRISSSDAGIEVHGQVNGTTQDGTPFEVSYVLEFSPQWEIQHVQVGNPAEEGVVQDVTRENNQWFDAEGKHMHDFDGVEFVDLSVTPLTNTIPIKRLQFENDKPQRIGVMYIDLPKFEIRYVEQVYSKVGKNTYRYEDTERPDFRADIVVDDDGLVLVYPGLFTQAATE